MWVTTGTGTGTGANTIAYSRNGTTWTGLGTSIFSSNGYGIACNALKKNSIIFSAGNTRGIVSGTDITISNTNEPLEVVSESYHQEGLISTSVNFMVA